MRNNLGFTTIELVTVIIIVAILAINILPKFDGSNSYQAHTHRAQLISALRLTQQRAMQQTDSNSHYCHQLIIEAQRYGVDDRTDCTKQNIMRASWQPDLTGHIVESGNNITFSIGGNSSVIVRFDWLGRPSYPTSNCNGGCTITVTSAVESLDIKIEAEGYIHGL
ncbi:MSHA fimbrial minor subunit MshC [Colwellia asteriadis]|uniref:MSHA fimbrial minor subunit MshC n=1 Tax=Colwellia asteriadis TaxID=517723 RepID=A0ABN1L3B3_9GAMM